MKVIYPFAQQAEDHMLKHWDALHLIPAFPKPLSDLFEKEAFIEFIIKAASVHSVDQTLNYADLSVPGFFYRGPERLEGVSYKIPPSIRIEDFKILLGIVSAEYTFLRMYMEKAAGPIHDLLSHKPS